MATLPAPARHAANDLVFRRLTKDEFRQYQSLLGICREQAVLFARRRMLDWKSQVRRIAIVGFGSALIFVAWKSIIG